MPRDTTVEDAAIDLLKAATRLVRKLSILVDKALEEYNE